MLVAGDVGARMFSLLTSAVGAAWRKRHENRRGEGKCLFPLRGVRWNCRLGGRRTVGGCKNGIGGGQVLSIAGVLRDGKLEEKRPLARSVVSGENGTGRSVALIHSWTRG
jgi:hypothetical protein